LGKSWQCMNVRITQLLQNKRKLQQTTCIVLFNLSDGRTEMTVVKTCTIDKKRQERKHSTLTLLAPSHYLAEAKKKYRYRVGTISILSFFPSFLLNPISSTYSMKVQSYCCASSHSKTYIHMQERAHTQYDSSGQEIRPMRQYITLTGDRYPCPHRDSNP